MKSYFNSNHTFVIAEAGSNWKVGTFDEDIQMAKKLIKTAKESDADAVKFQTYKSETVYVKNAGKSDYLSKNGIDENINDIFDRLSMPYEMIPELSEYCKKLNIKFMSTPFSVEDAKNINPFVEIHKIASFEINHIRLLEFISKTKKPIIVSTGASTFNEIDFAMEIFKKNNNEVAFLQCTSKYPSPINALNLSVIPKIKQRYNVPVGLSDHSIDPIIAPLVAIGFGANIIEKHFTLDKNLKGPDHSFALDPIELKQMITNIRNADASKGNGKKEILNEEKELREYATRSIQAIKKIKKGEIFKEGENIEVLRSGNRKRGIEARFLESIIGKQATQDIEKGDGVNFN
jgi:N,N'-diacetyllegionaminate synthase